LFGELPVVEHLELLKGLLVEDRGRDGVSAVMCSKSEASGDKEALVTSLLEDPDARNTLPCVFLLYSSISLDSSFPVGLPKLDS
jgi:hypothetical protein